MLDTKYNELLDFYEENKYKPFDEWLVFDRMIKSPGKQGVVGILKSKDGRYSLVFKMSQNMNFIVEQELTVMQSLNGLYSFCPYFCKGIGSIKCNIEPDIYAKNPFKIKSKYPIKKDVLLSEYVERSSKFCSYIYSSKIEEDVLYSIIKQVLLGINIAQKLTNFSHYDLHSDNIMIKKCHKDLVFLYKMDDENQFCVPSLGYYPVIIDFGFSFAENMNYGPLWSSMGFTDSGFMSDRFDWVADPKLFLVTVSSEIKECRPKSSNSIKFRNIVKNMFSNLTIDMKSGWDSENKMSAIDYVIDKVAYVNKKSRIFEDYVYVCFDILQSLIILPLEPQGNHNIEKVYEIFINEWIKIENEIGSQFYNIYILKELVNIARDLRADYENGNNDDKSRTVKIFKREVMSLLESVSSLCEPQNIHFEKMLCSLYILSRSIEDILYHIMKERMDEKEAEYKTMPAKCIEEIYAIIEANIEDKYRYNIDTVFLIMDIPNEKYDIFNIPESEIENINSVDPICRGTYIYDLFLKS